MTFSINGAVFTTTDNSRDSSNVVCDCWPYTCNIFSAVNYTDVNSSLALRCSLKFTIIADKFDILLW